VEEPFQPQSYVCWRRLRADTARLLSQGRHRSKYFIPGQLLSQETRSKDFTPGRSTLPCVMLWILLLRYLDAVPQPKEADCPQSPLYHERPCLAVIPAEVSASSVPHDQQDVNGLVQFYSFPSNTIVHSLTFQSRVLSLRTSKRIIVVAVDAQVCVCRY
jgi:hypothetical protein